MPIAALPDDTVRLLGSSTVVTTPVDLVKELLDNAIDAKAGTVAVLISQNTVDKIEVRDNGDGIHPNDYNALGRSGHTSKITSFQEIQRLGGATLGFRGQALASANSLGTVNITTRTAQDSTAVTLKLLPGIGGVESQRRASAPVGTTVSVSRLFSQMPVREQFSVKEAQKCLSKISRLLHSYALARPQTRLSLRVLGESNKRSWLYSPAQGATIKEAVCQVFGNEVASHSMIRTICSDTDYEDGDTIQREEKLVIEALLPKPGADQAKVSSKVPKGSFFSIDSRPVSTQRGPVKKLQSMFKDYYSKSLGLASMRKAWKDPCICVNIRCPLGTYDPNIEPSKNIILFAEESLLINLFGRLLLGFYSPDSSNPFVTIEKRQLLRPTQTRTPPPSSSGPVGDENKPVGPTESPRDQVPQMEQSLVQSSPTPGQERHHDPCLSPNPVSGLVFREGFQAAQIFPAHPPVVPVSERQDAIRRSTIELVDAQLRQGQRSMPRQQASEPSQDIRRRHSSIQVGSRGFVVNMSADPDMTSDEEAETLSSRFRGQQDAGSREETEVADTREGLNPWSIAKLAAPARQPGAGYAPSAGSSQDVGLVYGPQGASIPDKAFDDSLPILRPCGRLPASEIDSLRPTRLGIAHMSSQSQQLPGFQHPNPTGLYPVARPTAHDVLPNLRSYHSDFGGAVEIDGLVQTRLAFEGRRGSKKRRNNQAQLHIDDIPLRSNPPYGKPKKVNPGHGDSPSVNPVGGLNNSVADVLDSPRLVQYEISRTTHQSRQQPVPEYGQNSGESRNHWPEWPVTSLSSLSPGNEKWLDLDSRKYLMRRQRSEAEYRRKGQQPPKRTKSNMLPLEKVPETERIQHLVLTVVLDTEKLGQISGATTGVDIFCNGCRAEMDLSDDMNLDDITDIEVRLRIVLAAWTEKVLGQKTEVSIDIRSQAKRKAMAT